jgi:hypothetical protein
MKKKLSGLRKLIAGGVIPTALCALLLIVIECLDQSKINGSAIDAIVPPTKMICPEVTSRLLRIKR